MWSPRHRLIVTSPPVNKVLSVDEVKAQARLSLPGEADPFDGAEDSLIETYIQAAIDELDAPQGWLGRSLITRTMRLSLDYQPQRIVRLPGPPIEEVTAIDYLDHDGAIQSADLDDFMTDLNADESYIWPKPGKIWPATLVAPGRIRITYTAGYGLNSTDVPEIIRHALLIMAATSYRDRETSTIGTVTTEHKHIINQLASWRVM